MREGFVLMLFVLPLCAQAGSVYKSTGPNGQVIYSDQPPVNGKVDKKLNFSNLPATPLPASALAREKNAAGNASASPKVTAVSQLVLFMAQWCGYCKQAKTYLNAKHIRYTEYDIDTHEGQRMMTASGGGQGIPVLLWQGQKISGFSSAAYDAVFKSYPY